MTADLRIRLFVAGIVQGVGFRPFVHSAATQSHLSGFACNETGGVAIEVQGLRRDVQSFVRTIVERPPALARIDTFSQCEVGIVAGESGFRILAGQHVPTAPTAMTPDLSVCDECLAEMHCSQNRRHLYPFITCAQCGPRLTIISGLPYERQRTSMTDFPMCESCLKEFQSPGDRRFHAESISCPDCGPNVWYQDFPADSPSIDQCSDQGHPKGLPEAFFDAVRSGKIVAVKGIGGFHLVCSARDSDAVQRLRERKQRPRKPLAVMVRNVESVLKYVDVAETERCLLKSPECPIVLLRKKASTTLPDNIAPGNGWLGVMLPYSPMHDLMCAEGPLVVTSGNISDAPICRTNREAIRHLSGIADGFLFHNRDILNSCDDSVVRMAGQRRIVLRSARGFAPVSLPVSSELPKVLAVGAEMKSAFGLGLKGRIVQSPHIGELTSEESLQRFEDCVGALAAFFDFHPEVVACDLHPDYLTTVWAKRRSEEWKVPLIPVQHHHAHLASLMADHQWPLENQLIGVVFDGTGFGTDGTIWGGEFLVASGASCQRRGHLKTVGLPGGSVCVGSPYRTALSHLHAAGIDWDEQFPCVRARSMAEQRIIRQQLERQLNCPQTSSVGRLFDAVASVAGICQVATYEGQAAVELESVAARSTSTRAYTFALEYHGDVLIADPAPMWSELCADVVAGTAPELIVSGFLNGLTDIVVKICQQIRHRTELSCVGLSGGVFQNAVFLHRVATALEGDGFSVLSHQRVPPNDGGIAVGQAIVASCRLLKTV